MAKTRRQTCWGTASLPLSCQSLVRLRLRPRGLWSLTILKSTIQPRKHVKRWRLLLDSFDSAPPRAPLPPPPLCVNSALRVAKDTLMGLPLNSLPETMGREAVQGTKKLWNGRGRSYRIKGRSTIKPIDGRFGRRGVVKRHRRFSLWLTGSFVRVQVDHWKAGLLVNLRKKVRFIHPMHHIKRGTIGQAARELDMTIKIKLKLNLRSKK